MLWLSALVSYLRSYLIFGGSLPFQEGCMALRCFVALWFILRGDLQYVFPCVILFLCFLSPFSIAITSLGEERANLSAFRTFVLLVLIWICRFPLPLGVWEGLRFVIVALPGLFSYFFSLSLKDVMQLEQLQRSFMKRIQSLPVNAATAAACGLLGIRPIQQELDLRKLTLMGSVLYHKNTLEHEIAQRQLAVKSIGSKSWFAECNRRLYKYDLPNIYHVDKHIDSLEHWKTQIKTQIDSYIEVHCYRDSKSSLRYLNVRSIKVGQTHPVWKSLTHDVRTVKRVYPKLRLLTGTYILQKKRAKFNQYDVSDCCLLCGAGAETRVHFVAECPRLDVVRNDFREELRVILNHNNPEGLVDGYLGASEKFVELILDCSCESVRGQLCIDNSMWHSIECLSRTLRKHAYSNILKFYNQKKEKFQIKKSDIFHISAQNIDCGYSLEPPRRGGSNEYPQSVY